MYIGGGHASGASNEYIVMRYNPNSGEASCLPKSNKHWFAMASVNDQLFLAGGGRHSTDIQLLDIKGNHWITHSHPSLSTGRAGLTAVGYQNYLIVACGYE